MEGIQNFLSDAENLVWNVPLIVLLVGTGLYLTVLLRGLQFRLLTYALWLALIKRKEAGEVEGDITHYQALSTALAATVGVGNIAGVATAIHLGGPGALFWMWVTGLVGMATKYGEAFLGVRFRRTDARGEQSGGPMFYLSSGIRGTFGSILGLFFAVAGAIAAFGIGNMVQANSVADQLESAWSVPAWLTGLLLTAGAGVVILGGIKWIGRFTAAFVPLMAILYILGATVVLAVNITEVPGAIGTIFAEAFTPTSATGGFVGVGILAAIRYGVERGIFSNESGLGTGGIAAAAAKTTHPVRQALVSMTQTFLDTLVVVTFTGLAIVVTGAWTLTDSEGEALTGAPLTAAAFSDALPGELGDWLIAVALALFAFSTLIGWSYYGERCMDRLFGRAGIIPYRMVFVPVIFIGSVWTLDAVWSFAGAMNGLMALPNLIGLLILSPLIVRETREFLAQPDWQKVMERAR